MRPSALFIGLLSFAMFGVSARAAECAYDLTPLPVKKGVVSRIVPEGILLSDGTTVLLPESLLTQVRQGKSLAVRGLASLNGRWFRAFALDGNPPVCPPRMDIKRGAFPGSPEYDVIENGVSED